MSLLRVCSSSHANTRLPQLAALKITTPLSLPLAAILALELGTYIATPSIPPTPTSGSKCPRRCENEYEYCMRVNKSTRKDALL
ncbi:hypothetical protein BU26DRAFT_522137 [Trematosphaeria pertusa]|uniref:Uncharacterized protein n=1 Tax=Trematosphaeria pertusa TaxID=390896 RepID=A0A6A6I5X0_9PLEO|nr:uncharacterized protein BU26DRAFT_522137 [Trematosphaeria pertusa]KAF2245751.1 hypothetical protein BU26DRAFT_522137 [Trematosphaeria pertusa]